MTDSTTPVLPAPSAPAPTLKRRSFVIRHLLAVLASGPLSYFFFNAIFVQLLVMFAPLAMLFKAGPRDRATILISVCFCLVLTTLIGGILLVMYVYALGSADWR